jgi:hypothetical protein
MVIHLRSSKHSPIILSVFVFCSQNLSLIPLLHSERHPIEITSNDYLLNKWMELFVKPDVTG